MPYIGNNHIAGDHTNNFKVLDDISSFTATFDGSATSVVDTTNNTIRVVEHRFIQGQRVTYTNGGGGNIGGLSNEGAYFVIFDTPNTIKLATNASNAAGSTAINLSAVGTGSSHTLNAAFDGVNKKFKLTHGSGTDARLNNATQISVAINNVVQRPNLDPNNFTDGFALEDNHKIVFQTAPSNEDIFWGSIIANTLTTFDISDHKIDTFTGDGSTTEFNLSHIPANNESLMVTINGVLQHPSNASTARAYTLIANVIQFTAAPGVGDEIQVRHMGFAGATTADVSGFYGRTGNVVLTTDDNISVGNVDANGDLDVDGHTELDNVNISGLTTAALLNVNNLTNGRVTYAGAAGRLVDSANLAFNGSNLSVGGNVNAVDGVFSGNVSIGGTLTYEDVTNIDSVGIITARDGIFLPDNKKIELGNVAGSGDLQLYHDGGHSRIVDNGTGNLVVQTDGFRLRSTDQSEVLMMASKNNSVDLYYDNDKKFETSAKGIQVGTGVTIETSGQANFAGITTISGGDLVVKPSAFPGVTSRIKLGYAEQLQFSVSSANQVVMRSTGAYLQIASNLLNISRADMNLHMATFKAGREIILTHNYVDRLVTSGVGVTVYNQLDTTNLSIAGVSTFSGNIDANGDLDVDGHTNLDNGNVSGVVTFSSSPSAIDMNDNSRISFGTSLKTSMFYNASESKTYIRNWSNTLQIGYRNTEIYHTGVARLTFDSGNTFSNAVNTNFSGANYNALWIPASNMFRLNDNAKLALGSQADAEFYHNGSNLYLQNDTGHIYIQNNVAADVDKNIYIQAKNGENSITCENDGEVYLFSNQVSANQQKLRTSNTGIVVTGIGTFTDKLSVTGSQNSMLTNNQLIFDRAGTSYIDNSNDSGSLSFRIGSSYTVGLFIDSNTNVSIPSKLMHHGDANTFMEFGNDSINFDTAGIERLRIKSNGQIGVGDFSSKLAAITDPLCVDSGIGTCNIGGNYIHLSRYSGGYTNYITAPQNNANLYISADDFIAIGVDHSSSIYSHNTEVLRITSGGVSFNDKNITNVGTIACDSIKGDADDNTNITFAGSDVITFKAGTTSPALTINTTQVKVEDDQELTIGTGNDLKIFHDSSAVNNVIEGHTGSLNLRNYNVNSTNIVLSARNHILLQTNLNETAIQCLANGATEIFHDGGATPKLRTTATGVEVLGEVAASQDYPNIRPTLDFNFVAEKKLDSRIVYQRTGPASYHDENGKLIIVGDNIPRFDHTFPVYYDDGTIGDSNSKGEPKGLLIEESRTNLYKNNHSLKTANDHANISYVLNTTETTAPDGTFTATKVTGAGWTRWDGNNGLDLVGVNFTDTFSTSIYMKTVGTSNINVGIDFGDSGNATFSVGQEWKRYSISNVHQNYGGSTKFIDIVFDSANGVYIWGLQCENGKFPTSYIPTTGTTMTRGDESFEIDGEDFTDFFNTTEGTVLSHITPLDNSLGNHSGTGGVVWSFDSGAGFGNGNYLSNANSTTSFSHTVMVGSSGQNTGGGTSNQTNGVPFKNATVFKKDDFIMATNGTTASADTSGNLPTVVKLVLGNNGWANAPQNTANIYFNRFAYYPKRLPNSQLVTLTS